MKFTLTVSEINKITLSTGFQIAYSPLPEAVQYLFKNHHLFHISEKIHYQRTMDNHTYTILSALSGIALAQ